MPMWRSLRPRRPTTCQHRRTGARLPDLTSGTGQFARLAGVQAILEANENGPVPLALLQAGVQVQAVAGE